MNQQIPVITRRPKTEQTTPNVTARPLLEAFFSEAVLEFGVDVKEGREEVDDDDVSFASRTVYLGKHLKFAKKLEEKCIQQGIQDCKSLTGRY